MHNIHFDIIVVFLVCLFATGFAQQCQSFDPTYALASKDVCPPFLQKLVSSICKTKQNHYDILHIWSPSSYLYSQGIIDELFNSSKLWMVKALQSIAPTRCYQYLISLGCNSAFQPCQNVYISEINQTGTFPINYASNLTIFYHVCSCNCGTTMQV